MATTTNYSWTTPDDTALVKDGAAAIRTLGSSIDTTTKNLNPSTTLGDIEYRSSTANTNTRLGIGSTGQVLTVAGGVPSWATPSTSAVPWTKTTSGSLTGSSISITGLTKNDIMITVNNYSATSTGAFAVRWNNDSGNNYGPGLDNATNKQQVFSDIGAATSGQAVVSIQNAQSDQAVKMTWSNLYTGFWLNSAAVSSATIFPTAGSFDNGSYEVWER